MNIYFSGSFDLFHVGHLESIKEASKIAKDNRGKLIVGVNTDDLYNKHKKQAPIVPYIHRKAIVEAIKGVDQAVPQNEPTMTANLEKYCVDIYIISEEFAESKSEERQYMAETGGKVVLLPYYKKWLPSSQIKKHIKEKYEG